MPRRRPLRAITELRASADREVPTNRQSYQSSESRSSPTRRSSKGLNGFRNPHSILMKEAAESCKLRRTEELMT